jgi:DNA-binding CsgD family transcriptional regulator
MACRRDEEWRSVVSCYAGVHRLSTQEHRLLVAAVEGMTDKEAGIALGCARGTIGTYWQRIFVKTGSRPRSAVLADVLRFAARTGS